MENKTTIRLEGLIAAEIDKMKRCAHVFGEPTIIKKVKRVGFGEARVELGVDSFMGPAYYEDVEVPVWIRECHLCGLMQMTEKQKPVSYSPDFS